MSACSSPTGDAAPSEGAASPSFSPLWLAVVVAWQGRDWPVRLRFSESGKVRDVRAIDPPDGSDRWTEVAEACAGLSELIGHDIRPMTALDVSIMTAGLQADGFMAALVETVARVEMSCADPVRSAYTARANRVREASS
ncbi:hypothetical protein [Azospirillum sp.]|uniref:hypothetical protein n=1 Tax=Azospirillum sp. TaxID=34012 RepID=UPI00261FDC1C|nr:hypothetical protein [Azospirillum sp.]